MIRAQFQSWNISNQPVLVRADLNVPLHNNKIISDFKLKAFEPTLQELLKQQATIIIATHIGNPSEHHAALSTQLLMPWFSDRGYSVSFAPDIATVQTLSQNNIILLENLRFFAGEKEQSTYFAHTLAKLGNYYINDAFGVLHRSDASVTQVPSLFAVDRRSCGLLVEKELRMLTGIRTAPQRPYVCILGGGKPETKLPLLTHLLPLVDTMVVLPALSNTYCTALQQPVGKSIICKELVAECLQNLRTDFDAIILPVDYQVTSKTVSDSARIVAAIDVQDDDIIIAVGPKTLALVQAITHQAGTIVINGLPGFYEFEHTLDSAKALLTSITQSTAHTIVCGSDSIALAEKYNFLPQFTYASTGGGATLAYLAGQILPGLHYL